MWGLKDLVHSNKVVGEMKIDTLSLKDKRTISDPARWTYPVNKSLGMKIHGKYEDFGDKRE